MANGEVEVRGARNDATGKIDGKVVQKYVDGAARVKASSSVPHAVDVPVLETGYALSAAGTGTGGAAGDYLDTMNFSIKVATSNKITLYDGGTEIWSTTATTAIGFYTVSFRRTSQNGAFTLDTQGNSANLMCTGEFT
jgi:hypothetical protein